MIVTFNYAQWQTLYPQFATTVTTEAQAQEYFYQAQLYCDNSNCSIIPYDPTCTPPAYDRAIILNLLTAHVAQLTVGCVINGDPVPAGPLVGRISSATEGTVTVQAELPPLPASAGYYSQTQFGYMAYTAMARYRAARYRASPGRFYQPPAWPFPFPGQQPYGYP